MTSERKLGRREVTASTYIWGNLPGRWSRPHEGLKVENAWVLIKIAKGQKADGVRCMVEKEVRKAMRGRRSCKVYWFFP